jgi:hypothetical protein
MGPRSRIWMSEKLEFRCSSWRVQWQFQQMWKRFSKKEKKELIKLKKSFFEMIAIFDIRFTKKEDSAAKHS